MARYFFFVMFFICLGENPLQSSEVEVAVVDYRGQAKSSEVEVADYIFRLEKNPLQSSEVADYIFWLGENPVQSSEVADYTCWLEKNPIQSSDVEVVGFIWLEKNPIQNSEVEVIGYICLGGGQLKSSEVADYISYWGQKFFQSSEVAGQVLDYIEDGVSRARVDMAGEREKLTRKILRAKTLKKQKKYLGRYLACFEGFFDPESGHLLEDLCVEFSFLKFDFLLAHNLYIECLWEEHLEAKRVFDLIKRSKKYGAFNRAKNVRKADLRAIFSSFSDLYSFAYPFKTEPFSVEGTVAELMARLAGLNLRKKIPSSYCPLVDFEVSR